MLSFCSDCGGPEETCDVLNALHVSTVTVCELLIGFDPHPVGIILHIQIYISAPSYSYQQNKFLDGQKYCSKEDSGKIFSWAC